MEKSIAKKTHKKFKTHITPKTLEQIYNMRKNYSTTINKNEFLKDIVSIDETSININDLRRYGYIKKGKELQKHFQHKHTKEIFSCLSAISTDGFMIYKLFKGTVNSENYLSFIKEFLTILFYKKYNYYKIMLEYIMQKS